MVFSSNLLQGTLIKRYKRFIADVQLDDGSDVQAHCPNTGPMTGISGPGMRVALSYHDNPRRKLCYTWEMTQVESGQWVGVNTHRPNDLFHQAFNQGQLAVFKDYSEIRSEVRWGDSRFDFLLRKDGHNPRYVEIKNAHMKRNEGVFFPDTVTARGTKHIQALTGLVEQGYCASLVYIVQRNDCQFLSIAHDIDPVYGKVFDHALKVGVSCFAYACEVNPQGICIQRSLPIREVC